MIFDDVVNKIDIGRDGGNVGLPMGFKRLSEHIPGIQQGTYYVIGGETGSGKTALVDNSFMYNPCGYILNNDVDEEIDIIYYSFEIDKDIKITKGICRKIFLDYGLLVDVNFVLSRGKNRISQEVYDIVMKTKDYFYKLEDHITVIDSNTNPTGIWKYMLDYSNENGKWDNSDKKAAIYKPNNPKLYTIIIVDHVGLLRQQQGNTKKENIDQLSRYLITLRNKCGYIPVIVSQFNRDLSSSDRFRQKRVDPQLSDFKDTGNLAEDANVVMSLFSPSRYGIKSFRGYNTEILKDKFKNLTILKNRDGEADKAIGLEFFGKVGFFREYPKAIDMNYETELKLKL